MQKLKSGRCPSRPKNIASALLLLLAFPSHAFAEDESMRQLSGSEIEGKLSGKRITLDHNSRSSAPPFGEFFYKDHKWLGTLQAFSFKTVNGHWVIEGNHICTSPIDGKRECRLVWIDTKDGRILLKPLDLWWKDSSPVSVSISNID